MGGGSSRTSATLVNPTPTKAMKNAIRARTGTARPMLEMLTARELEAPDVAEVDPDRHGDGDRGHDRDQGDEQVGRREVDKLGQPAGHRCRSPSAAG